MYPGDHVLTWVKTPFMPWVLIGIHQEDEPTSSQTVTPDMNP